MKTESALAIGFAVLSVLISWNGEVEIGSLPRVIERCPKVNGVCPARRQDNSVKIRE